MLLSLPIFSSRPPASVSGSLSRRNAAGCAAVLDGCSQAALFGCEQFATTARPHALSSPWLPGTKQSHALYEEFSARFTFFLAVPRPPGAVGGVCAHRGGAVGADVHLHLPDSRDSGR